VEVRNGFGRGTGRGVDSKFGNEAERKAKRLAENRSSGNRELLISGSWKCKSKGGS
jgi:hypothetical protein